MGNKRVFSTMTIAGMDVKTFIEGVDEYGRPNIYFSITDIASQTCSHLSDEELIANSCHKNTSLNIREDFSRNEHNYKRLGIIKIKEEGLTQGLYGNTMVTLDITLWIGLKLGFCFLKSFHELLYYGKSEGGFYHTIVINYCAIVALLKVYIAKIIVNILLRLLNENKIK